MILLIAAFSLNSGSYSNSDYSGEFSPADTRLMDPSSTLCQGLALNSDKGHGASLYLLNKEPALDARNNFSLSQSYSIRNAEFKYVKFYLHPGSEFKLTSCSPHSGLVTLYVIQGARNYHKWANAYSASSRHTVDEFNFNNCGSSSLPHTFTVNTGDQYYFVFYNDASTTSVKANMTFDRTEYTFDQSTVVSNCSVSKSLSSCSVPISFKNHLSLLVQTAPLSSGDTWDDNIGVDTSCQARVLFYVVITVVPFAGVALLLLLVMALCLVVFKKKKQSNYPPIGSQPINGRGKEETADTDPLVPSAPPPMYTPNE